jgi:hypothetical protein
LRRECTLKDYLFELGDRQEFNELQQMLVNLEKGTKKELIHEFFNRTDDELQDQCLGPAAGEA